MSTNLSLKDQLSKQRYPPFRQKRQLIEEFSESRIITKNLVYVIGLSSSIANKDKLLRYEYFGQYGTIVKIVVNKSKAYNQNSPNGPSFSAYVTFSKPSEASIAILSLDETMIDNHLVRASFGTTKYCSFFLKGVECTNKECLFLHRIADESDIIKRGDLNSNKTIFALQHSYAIKIADVYNPAVKKKLMSIKKGKTVFPSPDLIYRSIFVIENDPNYHKEYNSKKVPKSNNINPINPSSPMKREKNDINSIKTNSNRKSNSLNTDATSNSSKEEENICSNNTKEHPLYFTHESSRFKFAIPPFTAKAVPVGIEVPSFIRNIINKQIKLRRLTKFMHSVTLDSLCEYNSEDEWAKFIKDHTEGEKENNHSNDEYIKDFENINSFIISKYQSENKKVK